ncbi:hypothetical protein MAPG_03214 [Magnaporthiopsis poae ATCC 64411]|uniref:Uncharacterized protein n=1 Tax=Magnaporthiopsis poae (strain ATCC 64411 / 73-15) TaxID=644358 RepID=A0A0C4DTE8_MAGP6|nr:hypothetical protein MAPG_03214 [Magnaporthiopsis poae ATCC 64411]
MLPGSDASYFRRWLVSLSGITTGEEPIPSTPLRAPAAQGREETLDWMQSQTPEEREAASRRLEAVIAMTEARARAGERQTGLTEHRDVQIPQDGSRPLEDVAPVLPQFTPEDGFESLSRSVLSEPVFRDDDGPTTTTNLTPPPAAWCPPGHRNSRDNEVGVSTPGPSRAQPPPEPRSPSPSSCNCSVQRSMRLVSELASYLCIPSTSVADVLRYVVELDRLRVSLALQYPQDAARFNIIDWSEALSADTAAALRGRRRSRCWCAAPRVLRFWVRLLALFDLRGIPEALDVIRRREDLFPLLADKERKRRVKSKARAWDFPGIRPYRLTGVLAVYDVGFPLITSGSPKQKVAVARVREWKPPGRSTLHISENIDI